MADIIKILLIEDNPGDSALIEQYLSESEKFDFKINCAARISSAIELLNSTNFNIILLDLGMPDSSGIDSFLRINSVAPELPIIVISGNIDDDVAIEAVRRGAQDYLIKGRINSDILLRAVRYAIERKHSEDILHLRGAAMENAANAILITDKTGVIQYVNPAFEFMTGYKSSEALGKNPSELIKSGHHDTAFYKEMWDTISSGKVWHGELLNRRKNGEEYIEEMTIAPVISVAGIVRNYVAITLDITERKFSEEITKLRWSLLQFAETHSIEELLQKGLDEIEHKTKSSISFYHFILEDQRTISLQAWSTQTQRDFCKAAGHGEHYDLDKAGVWADCVRELRPVIHNSYKTHPAKKGMPEGHADVVREITIPIIRNKRVVAIAGFGNKESDYNERDVETARYLSDVVWEIVERKRAEEKLEQILNGLEEKVRERTAELEEAVKELDSFSYTVSHDLRAPLRHITGFIGMLNRELGEGCGEKAGHYMDVIDRSAKKMGNLIDGLLAFSRLGKNDIRLKEIDLNLLITDILSEFSDEIKNRNVEVKTAPLPRITGDKALLSIVFQNLISNAFKFTKKIKSPEIEIGCIENNSEIVIFVRDNGAGFDMNYVDKLFGVFQRLHNDIEFDGTGIGLATVDRIVKRHNGKVRAEGETGKGAVFYITLPSVENNDRKAVL